MNEIWNDFKDEMKALFEWIVETCIILYKDVLKCSKITLKWIGEDGLLNLETSALLVCLFGGIFNEIASAMTVLIICVLKSCHDKYSKGSEKEFHDFLCNIIGIVLGMTIIYIL